MLKPLFFNPPPPYFPLFILVLGGKETTGPSALREFILHLLGLELVAPGALHGHYSGHRHPFARSSDLEHLI